MSVATEILRDVLSQIAASDELLGVVRDRRKKACAGTEGFEGVLRTYFSGSVAHGTAIFNADADAGAVLDRRTFPDLGPDGDGAGPGDIVEKFRAHLREELRADFPDVSTRLTKRGILVHFNDALDDGSDPSLDMIVALTRAEEPGLWIPHLKRDDWDASHPEMHTELFNQGAKALRVLRARIVRIVKAWNSQFGEPALSSFNIEALAWEFFESVAPLEEALADFLEFAAVSLAEGRTKDPAEVSDSIRLLLPKETVVARLTEASNLASMAANSPDEEEKVRDAYSDLLWDYVEPPTDSSNATSLAKAAKSGTLGMSSGGLLVRNDPAAVVPKTTRAYGAK